MKIHTFVHRVVGLTALWMIHQHRGHGATPRGFMEVINQLHEKLLTSETFKKTRIISGDDMFTLANEDHLKRFISATLLSIPEFVELNLREVEYNIGLRAGDVDDSDKRLRRLNQSRVPMGATRYTGSDRLKPEYEFIDLDALIRNVVSDIIDEQGESLEIKKVV